MQPMINHIQITAKRLSVAEAFYYQLMPLLGFDLADKSKGQEIAHEFHVIEYPHPFLIFDINFPRKAYKDEAVHRRKPGSLHNLAFKASSREQVDRLYQAIELTSAMIVEPPQLYPQHG
jgi:hypothetical protein